MSLKHEVKLVGEELQEKANAIDMDASMAQGVSFQLCLFSNGCFEETSVSVRKPTEQVNII